MRAALASFCLAASVVLSGSLAFAQTVNVAPDTARFADHTPTSNIAVDHSGWTTILRGVVLNVPPMDRFPERRRPVITGTRINTANTSRYRFEGNRVLYHIMPDDYRDGITTVREDLERLPEQIDGLANLSRDEQLAYWFNLHNVALVERILAEYPVTDIRRLRNGRNGAPGLFDERFLQVEGQTLSLNDIRLRIVYANWDDPRVLYGFINGSIGSPELRRTAFQGDMVWRQLDASADEFVNALRGVDLGNRYMRVSHVYDEARSLFPDFDRDLRTHLRAYATGDTIRQLTGNRPIRATVADWQIADMINGSFRCTGVGGATPMISYGNVQGDSGIVSTCGVMPTNARVLMSAVRERRLELFQEGRYGEVFTHDLPTDPDSD